MAIIEQLPAPAEGVQAFVSRIRPWAEADDGKPVFMLNLIRFRPQLRTFARRSRVQRNARGYRLIPDLRLIVGGSLLVLFLTINWFRAARHSQH